jgi:PAS domain S-box-containing protein
MKGRVWVVDDSRLQTERASRLLAEHYRVESFLEGAALLERLSEGEHPDLILLDWQMPGVSGLEVCEFLRQRYDEVTLPILMLTARGSRTDFTDGLSAGANDYVAKPYDDAELLARVRGLVRTAQQARAMREREEWFATTLRSIGDAVIATDPQGHITFFNQAAERLTGWGSADALGHPIEEVFTVIDEATGLPGRPVVERAFRGTEQAGVAAQALLLCKSGRQLPIEDSVGAIGVGGALGAVVVFRDASVRKRAAADAARRADFEEKLIGIVSHDLRNPLNAITLGTQVLLSGTQLDERAAKTMHRIRSSVESATRLVNDLLDFTQARLGSGIPVRRQPADLRGIVQQVVDELQPAYPDRRVQSLGSGEVRGEWDPDRLAQALMNLVSNALAYGEEEGTVTIRTQGDGDCATIAVHNCGTPIDAQLLPVLFEPLRRGSGHANRAARSVGLGLYIVKHIVDAHGGSIHVASSRGEGTTFSIRLPRHG